MLSNEHLKLLLQAITVVLVLHFAKDYVTGEYRNLMAVGLVAVTLMTVDHLLSEYEGSKTNLGEHKKNMTKVELILYNAVKDAKQHGSKTPKKK